MFFVEEKSFEVNFWLFSISSLVSIWLNFPFPCWMWPFYCNLFSINTHFSSKLSKKFGLFELENNWFSPSLLLDQNCWLFLQFTRSRLESDYLGYSTPVDVIIIECPF